MLRASLRSVEERSAKCAQLVHHVVIMFGRRCDAVHDPVEEVRVGASEQDFELFKLHTLEVREKSLGKWAEDKIEFLRAAVPAAEQKSPATDVKTVARNVAWKTTDGIHSSCPARWRSSEGLILL